MSNKYIELVCRHRHKSLEFRPFLLMSTDLIQTDASTVATPTVLRAEIDTDLDPGLAFDGYEVEFHAKGGRVIIERRGEELWINGRKVILYRSDEQQKGAWICGYRLREELSGKPILNACILDFLLEHTGFIPESWKKDREDRILCIFFPGTAYRRSDGSVCYRCLYFQDGMWRRSFGWLDVGFGSNFPMALLEEPVS